CSLTRNRVELTKLAPALSAAALTASSRSTLSLSGTSIALRLIGGRQATSPQAGAGASRTGSACPRALALAIAVARRAAAAAPAGARASGGAQARAPAASP